MDDGKRAAIIVVLSFLQLVQFCGTIVWYKKSNRLVDICKGNVDINSIFRLRGEKMGFTHFDEKGKAIMVDVTEKRDTVREATATGKITVNEEVFRAVKEGTAGKGDVLGVATTAGIMGAKRTSDLIPMCHILPITKCKVEFEMVESELAIYCNCTVRVTGKTGVEMEALTGASVALLTVYDMCKAMDKKMEIGEIYLVRKSGGKSGLINNGYKKERKEGEK